jgi:hypothetical protein
MFAEIGAALIAFDPTEMGQHGAPVFPQYASHGSTPNRQYWTDNHMNPSGLSITGFLDAFQALSLLDPSAIPILPPPPTLVDKPIWLIECSAERFARHPFWTSVGRTDYGVFLGTQFSNTSTAAPFEFHSERAFGFLL